MMISLNDVTLTYTIYNDQTYSLKETIINLFHRRSYAHKKNDSFDALNTLNLNIAQGERVGIIGRNGAGKSTLLKVISGVLKPSKGEVSVNGMIQPLIEIAAGFNPEFSGRENIYLNGYMLGFDRESIKAKEQEIIDFSELQNFIDVPVKYYSSGMAVRLAFTIATSIEPEILVFDEMLSAGDAAFFTKAKQRLDSLINRAKAVVLVSHDLNFIKNFTNRTLVIDQGKVVFDGDPESAVRHYLNTIEKSTGALPPKVALKVTKAVISHDQNNEICVDGTFDVTLSSKIANPKIYLAFHFLGKTHEVHCQPAIEDQLSQMTKTISFRAKDLFLGPGPHQLSVRLTYTDLEQDISTEVASSPVDLVSQNWELIKLPPHIDLSF